jgi:hypothetical protein
MDKFKFKQLGLSEKVLDTILKKVLKTRHQFNF